jgi:hypothetical protein
VEDLDVPEEEADSDDLGDLVLDQDDLRYRSCDLYHDESNHPLEEPNLVLPVFDYKRTRRCFVRYRKFLSLPTQAMRKTRPLRMIRRLVISRKAPFNGFGVLMTPFFQLRNDLAIEVPNSNGPSQDTHDSLRYFSEPASQRPVLKSPL